MHTTLTEVSLTDQSAKSRAHPSDASMADQKEQSASVSNTTSNLDLDALLLQHSEIGDWSAIVDKQIIENPLPLVNDCEDSKTVVATKAINTTFTTAKAQNLVTEFRPPFYAYVYGVNYAARKVDIFYFFGGPKNVADVHVYLSNATNVQQQQRFNRGDCLIMATGLEGLVEVLRKDGEEMMGRKINVDCVNPVNQERKRYSQQQLDNARLVPAPVISYNQNSSRGNYHRQDSTRNADHYGGSNQRSSYSPRGASQQTSPSGNSYQHKHEQQRRNKFMPNSKGSNDVRSLQQGGVQQTYNQNQRPPPAAPYQSIGYDRQSSYQQQQRSNASSQAWSPNNSNFQQQLDEIHPTASAVKRVDIFGAAKPVNTAKREQEIAAKLAEERMLAKERQLQQENASAAVPPIVQQQPQQFYSNSQVPRHSMGSNYSSSQQSLSQPQVRILKHTNHSQPQHQQRKQSISEAHPVPLNQCHPSSRGSVEGAADLDESINPPETNDGNQWSPELPHEEEGGVVAAVRHNNPPGRGGGYGRGARSGSESSSNFPHQQRHRNNQRNRHQNKDGQGRGGGEHYNREGSRFGSSQQQHSQYHNEHRGRTDNQVEGETEKGARNFNHHRSNNNVNEAHQRYQQQRLNADLKRSPPRLARGQIDKINKLVQPGQQSIKIDSKPFNQQQLENQQHNKGPAANHGHHVNKRMSFVNSSKRVERTDREGVPPRQPHARMTKKQSMDSKIDDSAREELNKHHPKAGQLRQVRSDSTPNVVSSKASEGTAADSKNILPSNPTVVAATVQGIADSKQPTSAKKNTKRKSNKKDATGSSNVATNNKFSALADSSM